MKRIILALVIAVSVISTIGAQTSENLTFGYDAGLELNTAWLWRGLYCGGMSLQPMADIGWDSEHTSFRAGVWMNIGAEDGTFRNELTDCNGENDVFASLNLWGAVLGFTHYNYWGRDYLWGYDFNSNRYCKYQNELTLGYDFGTLLNVPLTVMWNTVINDGTIITSDTKAKYSTYVEITYSHDFDKGWNLTGSFGFTPWKSQYTNFEGDFAINKVFLSAIKSWNIKGVCTMGLSAKLTMNPYRMGSSSPAISGCAGYSLWF